jgi:hypothetical protein
MISWIFSPKEIEKVNFETVQFAITTQAADFYIINTLSMHEQDCLILGTLTAEREESILNGMLHNSTIPDKKIIVFGKNSQDETPYRKASQLKELGIKCVYVYTGGMFEWLLLQDVYGGKEFPTTKPLMDILKYK